MADLLLGVKIGATGGPQTVREIKAIDNEVKRLQDQNKRAAETAKALAEAYDLSDAEVNQLVRKLQDLEQQTEQTANKAGRLDQVFTGFFEGLGRQASQVALQALQGVAQAVQDVATQSLAAVGAFDAAGAKVRTLEVDSAALGNELKGLAQDLGNQASAVELLEGSYDIISAGFADVADITKIADASVKGAIGGFSDFATVSDALTSALNAYGESADQAEAFTDKFIATQNAGKITVDQYAQQIGSLAPLAAQAGVGIDELNGFIATATAQGVQVSSTFAGLRQALASVLKPSSQATALAEELGIQFDAAALRSKGLQGILAELNAVGADTPEVLTVLLGSVEAVAAVAPSTGANIGKLAENIDASANSAGAAASAFATVADTVPALGDALQNQVADGFLAIGEAISPIQAGVLQFASDLLTTASQGSAGLGQLTDAAERFRVVLTGNPEIVERLGAALATVADSGVKQISLLIDAVTAFVGEQENIDQIAESFEQLATAIQVAGQGARFIVALTETILGLQRTVEGLPVLGSVLNFNPVNPINSIKQIQGAFEALNNIIRNSAEFVASLVARFDFLAQSPVIKVLLRQILETEAAVTSVSSTLTGTFSSASDTFRAKAAEVRSSMQVVGDSAEDAAERTEAAAIKIEDALKALSDANRDSLTSLGIEAAEARATILEAGGDPAKLAQAEAEALRQRLAQQREYLAEVKALQSASNSAEDAAKLASEVLQIEQSLTNDRVALAQLNLREKQRAEKAAADAAKKAAEAKAKAETDALKRVRDEEKRLAEQAQAERERLAQAEQPRGVESRRETRDNQRRAEEKALQQELQASDRAFQDERRRADRNFQKEQQSAATYFQQAQQSAARAFQKQLDAERDQGAREFDVLTSEVERRVQIQSAASEAERRALREQFAEEDRQLEKRRKIEKEVLRDRGQVLRDRREETQLSPLEQARADFEERLQAKALAFQEQQQASAEAFAEQQANEAEARAEQLRLADLARADELEQLKEERAEARRLEDKAFEDAERAIQENFEAQQRAAKAAFAEQQRRLDEANAQRIAAILAAARPAGIDGARKDGGPVLPGRTYLVGEQGPELVTPSRRGWVQTAGQTAAMMGGGAPMAVSVRTSGGSLSSLEAKVDVLIREVRSGRKVSMGPSSYTLNTQSPTLDAAAIEIEKLRALTRSRGL